MVKSRTGSTDSAYAPAGKTKSKRPGSRHSGVPLLFPLVGWSGTLIRTSATLGAVSGTNPEELSGHVSTIGCEAVRHARDDRRVGIGERVKWYRLRRGLSQEVLADRVGRTADWLSKVERGLIPVDGLPVIKSVADALDVSLGDLPAEPSLMEWTPDTGPRTVPALRDALMDYRQITRLFGHHEREEVLTISGRCGRCEAQPMRSASETMIPSPGRRPSPSAVVLADATDQPVALGSCPIDSARPAGRCARS